MCSPLCLNATRACVLCLGCVQIPVIMLNLLIALMGGSYERSQESSKNEGMKQRAGILNDYEVQMGKLERANRAMFPDWFAYFRIKQSEEVTPTEIGGGRGDGGADLAQLSKDVSTSLFF